MAAKIFEVGEVLPATTRLRISWNYASSALVFKSWIYSYPIKTDSDNFSITFASPQSGQYGGFIIADLQNPTALYQVFFNDDDDISWVSPYDTQQYCDIDISNLTLAQRTVSTALNSPLTWEDLNAPSGYTITFEENGGTSVTDLSEQTALPNPLPTPTKSGYTFVAWYYESNFQTRAKAGDTIEANTTLYAKWHNLGSLFTEIADAIRSKDGTSENIRDVDFGERIKQIQGAKEEQTKTVSPTTSSQDVLPDANKVLSKVTVNAIPTETKSQQPNLSSGDQTINATSGKFMTSFTITKDTTNHIASNIRSGKTLYGVTGNLQPAKEEETKTITPDFSSGNQIILPTTNKVLSQVTLNKPTDLIPENIAKDKNVCGVIGTLEGSGGYIVCIICRRNAPYETSQGYLSYSLDNGTTWVNLTSASQLNIILNNVTQIRFKLTEIGRMYASLYDCSEKNNEVRVNWGGSDWTGDNIILSKNKIYEITIEED